MCHGAQRYMRSETVQFFPVSPVKDRPSLLVAFVCMAPYLSWLRGRNSDRRME